MIKVEGVELASGLVGLGRQWPPESIKPIPTEVESILFLNRAVNEGIRFFDTAPAYGSSEVRLGKFLRQFTPDQPMYQRLIIATKVGEYWDPETKQSFVDHSFLGMKHSLTTSKNKLGGNPDIVLLHKSNKSAIQSSEFNEFADYALKNGVEYIGASVSDVETAEAALNNSVISYIQLPYNHQSTQFRESIQTAQKMGKVVIVNRPFSSGRLFVDISPADAHQARIEAFSYILQDLKKGFILSGTTDYRHLRQNINAFNQALSQHR